MNLIVVFRPLFTKPTWEHAKAVLLGPLLPSWQTRGHGLRGHPLYYHRGNTPGFMSVVAFIPDQKLGFAILTNVTESELPAAIGRIILRNLADMP